MTFWKDKHQVEKDHEIRNDSSRTEFKRSKHSAKYWSVLVGALIMLVGLMSLLYGTINYTSASSFCVSCHEMKPEHVTFQASTHNQIGCIQCHSKPGINNLVISKMQLLKEVYLHMNGAPSTIVQTSEVSSESCEQCHSRNRLVTATGDLIVNHQGHVNKNIPCMICHRGVVHAKISERGLNDPSTYEVWTKENAKKLMNDQYVRPNMGTCIDCHQQVNQGKEPWKNTAYILPEMNQKDRTQKAEEVSTFKETPEMKAGTLVRDRPKNKQKSMLEAIGKQKTGAKISMQCDTCHQQINKPKNHEIVDWSQNHGDYAVKELNECLRCHQDSLWTKETGKQDIGELLTETKRKEIYGQDLVTVKEESRKNLFCSNCHAYIPPSHSDRTTWLFYGHRLKSAGPDERRVCFVCHDNERPDEETGNAPSVVYCEFCHNKGYFSNES